MTALADIRSLSAAQFREELAAAPMTHRVLLDVRTPAEFEDGHIPDATLLPVQELQQRIDEVPTGRTVFVYCGHGQRSLRAAQFLVARGLGPVINLSGGIANWPFEIQLPA